MTAPNTANRPAPESVRWTNPTERYTPIVASGVGIPDAEHWVIAGTPITTNGGGVVTPTADNVGKYLDMGTGEIVEKATVDEWLAAWTTVSAAHPDWTLAQIQDAIAADSSSEPATSDVSAQSIHLDPSSTGTDLHNAPILGLGTLPTPSTDPNDKPIDGVRFDASSPMDMTGAMAVGEHVTADGANGEPVHAVILPHAPVSRMAALIAEIRNHVPASVAHFVTELEQIASEIRAHL